MITAASAGQTLHADAGDVLVLHLDNALFDVLPKGVEPWTSDGTTPLASAVVTDELPPGEQGLIEVAVPTHGAALRLTVVREAPRAGVDETWPA